MAVNLVLYHGLYSFLFVFVHKKEKNIPISKTIKYDPKPKPSKTMNMLVISSDIIVKHQSH